MLYWYVIVYWVSFLSYLLPIFFLLNNLVRNKTERKVQSVLFLYVLLSILTEITNLVVVRMIHNNNPVVHVYTILAFVVIAYLYREFLKVKFYYNYFYLIIFTYCGFSFYYSIYWIGFFNVNVISYLILTIFSIILSSYYFYKVYFEMSVPNLFQNGHFWINSAFLIYFSSTFYLSLFEEIIQSVDINLFYYTWPIQLISTIIFNVILSRGIWLMRKQYY